MGDFFTKAIAKMQGVQEQKLLMVGLDAAGSVPSLLASHAGKTTILYKLKLGEVVTDIPNIGFGVETVKYKHISFTVWDTGGQDKIRPLWRHYYENCCAVIWVVDSNDKERLDDRYGAEHSSKEELHRMMAEDQLSDVVLLVFANKQDLPNALSVEEVSKRLALHQLRQYSFIQGICANTGDGVYEGLDWLSNALTKTGRKERAKWRKQQEFERKKQEKSILVVSGYVREFYEIEIKRQMLTFIPVSVTKYIHLMFHDPDFHCDRSFKYYGEYSVTKIDVHV